MCRLLRIISSSEEVSLVSGRESISTTSAKFTISMAPVFKNPCFGTSVGCQAVALVSDGELFTSIDGRVKTIVRRTASWTSV